MQMPSDRFLKWENLKGLEDVSCLIGGRVEFTVTISAKHYLYEPFTGSLKYFITKKLSLKHISLKWYLW